MRVRIIESMQKAQNIKKKVCAYARVSTDSESQGNSFENQIQYYKDIISSNPDYQYVGVFADKGITGTTENRPEFQRMLHLCRVGKIDLIITKSISRLARNTAIVLQTVRQLKDIGVEVRFEKENINTLSGDGELMLTVLSSFAQEESKNISDNIKWRMRKKFERGELIINTTRFLGYDKDEYGDLIINFKEAKIVKRIFDEYLRGKGAFKIARELYEEGIPTAVGGKWEDACSGTGIDDEIVGRINIKEEIIVKEELKDGKKYYSYTSKGKQNQPCGEPRATEKENGSLLPSVHRPIRTVIKL